jgi:hypothetical protein
LNSERRIYAAAPWDFAAPPDTINRTPIYPFIHSSVSAMIRA